MKNKLLIIFLCILFFIPIFTFLNSGNFIVTEKNNANFNEIPTDMPLNLISEYTPPSEAVLGTDEVVIIMVDFSDQIGSNTKTYYETLYFGGIDGSLNDYYEEISYNQFTLTGEVVGSGWYRSSHTMVYYGADAATGNDNLNTQIYELAREAAILADDDVDFSQYDTDGNGIVDHLVIVHAGNDQATSHVTNDIWSHRWSIPWYNPLYLDGVQISGYTMEAETDKLGMHAHEIGHDIGLPDLYDGDYVNSFVRYWDLMAYGGYNDGGDHPSHMMAWSKMQLGWITSSKIVTVDDGDWKTVILDPLELTNGEIQVIKLPITSSTYFLVENRQQIGYDEYLPDEGIIISYVDETLDNYEGIIRVQDSRPSSISYPNDLNDAEFSSETGEVVVFRNSTYNITISICRKSGDSYELLVDRCYNPKPYTNSNFLNGMDICFSLPDKTAGQVIYWDWYCTNPSQDIDFWIKKNDSATLYEEVYNTNSEGGTFRIPENGTWELHFRNDFGSDVSIDYYYLCWTSPDIAIFSFYEDPITIYEGEDFDLYLTVFNTGSSLVEGATATITLPTGLSINNPTIEIGNLKFFEFKTICWSIHGDSSGTYIIDLSIESTWGGSETGIKSVTISEDLVNPNISIISPIDDSNHENTNLVVEWNGSDSQTGIDHYWLILDSGPQIVLQNTSYLLNDLTQGTHTIQIVAFDKSGRSNSDSITITVDYTDPTTATITSISNGNICNGGISILANALDTYTNIERVEFWDGIPGIGTLLFVDFDSGDGWGFIWNTSCEDNGDHDIYIRIFDELAHSLVSSGVSITVNNQVASGDPPFDLLDIVLIIGILSVGAVAGVFSILWIKEKKSNKLEKNKDFKGKSDNKIKGSTYEPIKKVDLTEFSQSSKSSEASNNLVKKDNVISNKDEESTISSKSNQLNPNNDEYKGDDEE